MTSDIFFDQQVRAALSGPAKLLSSRELLNHIEYRRPTPSQRRDLRARRLQIFTTHRAVAVVAAVLALVSGSVVAFATGVLTAPINIHFIPFPTHYVSPEANAGPCYIGRVTTLAEAERTVSYHIFTLSGFSLVPTSLSSSGVSFGGGCGQQNLNPSTRSVTLTYVVDNVPVQLNEGPAPNPNGNLTVNLKGGPSSVAASGLQIVKIDGSSYAVWMQQDTSKFPCSAGVVTAAWQIGGTVIYLDANYPSPTNWTPGMCYQSHIPWQTFLKIVHAAQ